MGPDAFRIYLQGIEDGGEGCEATEGRVALRLEVADKREEGVRVALLQGGYEAGLALLAVEVN